LTKNIYYQTEPPESFEQLRTIFEVLGWNSLNLSIDDFEKMCNQSWYAVYAFDNEKLVGMGRVLSDGVITGVVSGLCVLPDYQSMGIGKELLRRIIDHCEKHRIVVQLMCLERLESYYEQFGFKRFTIGMKRNVR
jgi:ribosomal protein S18 acetylase RimI-like enzyme